MKLFGFVLLSLIAYAEMSTKYEVTCPSGTKLAGSYRWTDQMPTGSNVAIFTCCPNNKPIAHYVNENYFCCPKGSGARCSSNNCNCQNGGTLSGGKKPSFKAI